MWDIGIIDDDENVRQLLQSILKLQGHGIKTFNEASDFIEYVENNPLDNAKLLIVDVMMPNMTGTEMVKLLSERGLLFNIPILYLSALGEDDHVIEAHNAGEGALTVDYVQKPFKKGWLLARVKNLLHLKKYHEELFQTNAQIMDMNLELKKLASQTTSSNESLKKLNMILSNEKSTIQKKYNTIKDHLEKMVIHDLPIIKFVSAVLEQNQSFIEETFSGVSEEEELFKMLPKTITPLKTVSSDIEQMVMLLVHVGMIDKEKLAGFEIKETTFYRVLEEIYERGGMSRELFDSFVELSKFHIKGSHIELF